MPEAESARPLRALVIQHEDSAPGGYIHQWLEERHADQDVYRIDIEARTVDARAYGLIVSLGSELAAYDDTIPWLQLELELLRSAARSGVGVLGICFGAQLLARALGGDAFRSEIAEIGWRSLRSQDHALISAGPWFQWHYDAFTPPREARLLASSEAGPQAYAFGHSLGVQFHPEVTPEIIEAWMRMSPQELDREGVDPDLLLEESRDRADQAHAAAWRLFDGFLAHTCGEARLRARSGTRR